MTKGDARSLTKVSEAQIRVAILPQCPKMLECKSRSSSVGNETELSERGFWSRLTSAKVEKVNKSRQTQSEPFVSKAKMFLTQILDRDNKNIFQPRLENLSREEISSKYRHLGLSRASLRADSSLVFAQLIRSNRHGIRTWIAGWQVDGANHWAAIMQQTSAATLRAQMAEKPYFSKQHYKPLKPTPV